MTKFEHDLQIEHCYHCRHCRGVRVFRCQIAKGKPKVSPSPKASIPAFCPLPDYKSQGDRKEEQDEQECEHKGSSWCADFSEEGCSVCPLRTTKKDTHCQYNSEKLKQAYKEYAANITPQPCKYGQKPSSCDWECGVNGCPDDATCRYGHTTQPDESRLLTPQEQEGLLGYDHEKLVPALGDIGRLLKDQDTKTASILKTEFAKDKERIVTSLRELMDAMHAYEIDVDVDAPPSHVSMMQRAEQALKQELGK